MRLRSLKLTYEIVQRYSILGIKFKLVSDEHGGIFLTHQTKRIDDGIEAETRKSQASFQSAEPRVRPE